jgi:hypothetical protein
VHADVLGDVERLGICPHRPPQPWSGPVQDLTKAWGQVQPPTDGLAHGLDQKSAVGVEQRSAVQGEKRPDVLGPALLLRPDQHEIRSGHALEPDRLAVDVRRIPSSLHTAGRHFHCMNEQTTTVTPTPSCRYRTSRSTGGRPTGCRRAIGTSEPMTKGLAPPLVAVAEYLSRSRTMKTHHPSSATRTTPPQGATAIRPFVGWGVDGDVRRERVSVRRRGCLSGPRAAAQCSAVGRLRVPGPGVTITRGS